MKYCIYMDANTDHFTPPMLRMQGHKDGTKEGTKEDVYPNTQYSEPLTNKIFMSV